MSWPAIFVSHSHADDDFGARLVTDLRAALDGDEGAVWYDSAGGLVGGETWWQTIIREIQARPVFLVVLSDEAMASKWVNDEINIAWNLRNSAAGKHILPVLLKRCDIREDLQTVHYIYFLPPRQYEEAFQDLLAALSSIQGQMSSPEIGSVATALTLKRDSAASEQEREGLTIRAGQPTELLRPLRAAYQHDLEVLQAYWTGVFYGPGDNYGELEKQHRLAYERMPSWRHRIYDGVVAARLLELDPATVANIQTLKERPDLFDHYRIQVREQFETEQAQHLLHDYSRWKREHEHGTDEERQRSQAEWGTISKRLNEFSFPNISLWNACAALINLIRGSGNPIPDIVEC